jgi:hypothetical protein
MAGWPAIGNTPRRETDTICIEDRSQSREPPRNEALMATELNLVAHPFLDFTVRTGTLLRDQIGVERAIRLSEPAPPEAASAWPNARANNHGFYSPVDYPWQPPAGERTSIIGLFGGSVTQFLTLQLGSELGCDLQAAGAWPSDRVAVLNFAVGGMKQPQNLAALTHFLALGQRLDAAVLIDGFGVAALSFHNAKLGYQPEAPSIAHLRDVEDVSRFALDRCLDPNDESAVAERIVTAWERSTREFHRVCGEERIPLVHLLQPNQYDGLRGSAAVEAGRATSPDSPYRRGVEVVFPLLREAARALTRDGVPVIDATDLFDLIPDAVYADTCCHYNLRGALALKNHVVDSLLRTIPRD